METKQQQQIEANKVPSPSSSPSHEFSFTISLHNNNNNSSFTPHLLTNNKNNPKSYLHPQSHPPPPPPFAIDLSPADDIFFHGHLLPLHLLSHLPAAVSPRSSTNSIDSFTLPTIFPNFSSDNNQIIPNFENDAVENQKLPIRSSKPKSFSFFRWRRKGCEIRGEDEDNKQNKKKLRFEVSRVLKRYLRMVRPLLFFKGRRSSVDKNVQFHRQNPFNSFSGNLSWRSKQDLRGRNRGEYSSAPASMRTSPTNSGLLVATATIPCSTGSDNSTMEELQAAIQAAIAHCKNSISAEDKIKC